MKLPNGYGSVSKVNRKNLRKKYIARITTDIEIDEQGKKHQHKKTIGYFETKEEALNALTNYNMNKDEVNILYKNITFSDLWEEWQNSKKVQALKPDTIKGYEFSYKLITDKIKNKKFIDIKFNDLQNMINELLGNRKGYQSVRKVKNCLSQIYKYAIKCDIVSKNYGELLDIGKSPRKGQALIFTDEQIERLWKLYYEQNEDTRLTIEIMLMLMYNGCRISEFLNLKIEDMNLKDQYFNVTDSKTDAGIRQVPISDKVINIYECIVNEREKGYFLINPNNKRKFTYANFRDSYWDRMIDLLGWDKNLTPHNCRKTCISKLTKAGVRPTYIKLIVGHEGALDLTEKTYTYVDFEELLKAINEI